MSDNLAFDDDLLEANPINLVEELISFLDLRFTRIDDDVLRVKMPASWCTYTLYFVWHPHVRALHFSCNLDIPMTSDRKSATLQLMSMINSHLWLGAFYYDENHNKCCFSYTFLISETIEKLGNVNEMLDSVHEVIDIALIECDRFYPAFKFLLKDGLEPDKALELVLIEPQGEA